MPRIPEGRSTPPWRDLSSATADGKVTRSEVKTLIAPHQESFSDDAYRGAVTNLLSGGSDVRFGWFGARDALATVVHSGTAQVLMDATKAAIENGSSVSTEGRWLPEGLLAESTRFIGFDSEGLSARLYLLTEGRLWAVDASVLNDETTIAFLPRAWHDCGPAPTDVQTHVIQDVGRLTPGQGLGGVQVLLVKR